VYGVWVWRAAESGELKRVRPAATVGETHKHKRGWAAMCDETARPSVHPRLYRPAAQIMTKCCAGRLPMRLSLPTTGTVDSRPPLPA